MKRPHDVFHVSKIKRYNKQVNDMGPLSIVIDADGNVEQEAEILDKKRENRRALYLVRFEGDPVTEAI